MPSRNGGDLVRKPVADVAPQAVRPLDQDRAYRIEQRGRSARRRGATSAASAIAARDAGSRRSRRCRYRSTSRGSVSERLRVWFSQRSACANASRSMSSTSSPPRSNARSACAPATAVQRRLLARARLGQQQRAGVEVERQQADLAGRRGAGLLPTQPTGDHQVQHQIQVAVERED